MTKSEWLSHEKRRIETKLSKSEYSRKIGLKVHIYHYYQRKYRAQSQAHSSPKFAKVIVEPVNSVRDFSITLELSKQGGLRFYGGSAFIYSRTTILSLTNEKGA